MARTHCRNGHELTPANTILHCSQRRCRKCSSLRYRAPRVEAALQVACEALYGRGMLETLDRIESILAGDKRLVP